MKRNAAIFLSLLCFFLLLLGMDKKIAARTSETKAAPVITTKINTEQKTEKVRLAKKAKRTKTFTKKLTKRTKTIYRNGKDGKQKLVREITTTKSSRYQKGSRIKKITYTTKIKVTTYNYDKASIQTGKDITRQGKMNIHAIAPKADAALLYAFDQLHTKLCIDPKAAHAGLYSARDNQIVMREADSHIYHELGHFLAFVAGCADRTKEFAEAFLDEKMNYQATEKIYARGSQEEFFASCYKSYVLENQKLKKQCPKTYRLIRQALGEVTPERVRQIKGMYGAYWKCSL